jgi:hypothetical protein
MPEVWYYIMNEGNESNKMFKLQKKVIWITSVSNHASCKQIFKDHDTLTPSSLYIVEYEECHLWDVMLCGSCKNRHFEGTQRLHHQGDKIRWARNISSN